MSLHDMLLPPQRYRRGARSSNRVRAGSVTELLARADDALGTLDVGEARPNRVEEFFSVLPSERNIRPECRRDLSAGREADGDGTSDGGESNDLQDFHPRKFDA